MALSDESHVDGRVQSVALANKFLRCKSDKGLVGCAGQTWPIQQGPTLHPTGLKGSAVKVLALDTTAHI